MTQPKDQRTGPLAGIRVIDLSAVVSGPFATSILADQGADVILVEQPNTPDVVRLSGPSVSSAEGVSAFWASMNRNKRAITLNLKDERGKALLFDLVRNADVVVQNFRPGVIDRLGLGWEVLRTVNPELVMCSISGYGADGPYVNRPAYDPVVQCVAGYPDVQADADGTPHLMATIVCDKVTSLNAAQAICAALVARSMGRGGQHLELAMIDASVHFLWPEAMWSHTYLDHETDVPDLASIYKLYATSDGWAIVYAISTDTQWQNMCRALGRDDLATDSRFADLQGRLTYGEQINDELVVEMAAYTTADIVELMERFDVPAAPVNTRQSMIDDPQVRHREILVESDHPTAGRIRSARSPVRFSETPSTWARHAPVFNQDTDEVLSEVLGLDAEALAELRSDHIIV